MSASADHPPRPRTRLLWSSLLILAGVASLHAEEPLRLGDLDASGSATVSDLVALLGHVDGSNPLPPDRARYADLNEDGAIDLEDVSLLSDAILGREPLPNPNEAPSVTAPVAATAATTIRLEGESRPNRLVTVEGGASTVQVEADGSGLFTIDVPLQLDRLNLLFVTASGGGFGPGTPRPLRIVQDSTPPMLLVDFPAEDATVTTPTTTVAGRVGDLLSGGMGMSVVVGNGALAEQAAALVEVGAGTNGTFARAAVPLVPGGNVLTVTATDALGNAITRQLQVTRATVAGEPHLEAISGDAQSATVMELLPSPLVVRALAADGTTPLAGQIVTFEVVLSDGRLLPAVANVAMAPSPSDTPDGALIARTMTDAAGEARALWTLGTAAGRANNRVRVTGAGLAGTAFFSASAAPEIPVQINVGSGNAQRGEAGGPVGEPLRAWVSDRCNGVAGVPVTFTVTEGGGKLRPVEESGADPAEGTSVLTVQTTATGHAAVELELGAQGGPGRVQASFPDNPGAPAIFNSLALTRTAGQPTSFRGFVFDNAFLTIEGARVELVSGGQTHHAETDAFGRFDFPDVPPGPGSLHVDGTTASSVLGIPVDDSRSFPVLGFLVMLVPNAVNELPTPILLPRLEPERAVIYDGTTDLVLTMPGIPGLKYTIAANSMRHDDGVLVSPGRRARVSLDPVQSTDIPMPLPDGASPALAWSLQPGGATFDPPVHVEIPNVSGLPPGSAVNLLTFSHATERFDMVGTAHVSPDGAILESDPGSGLPMSGWGASCPPYTPRGEVDRCIETVIGPRYVLEGEEATFEIDPQGLVEMESTTSSFPGFPGQIEILSTDPATGEVRVRGVAAGEAELRVTTERDDRRCSGEQRIRVFRCGSGLGEVPAPHPLAGGGWTIGSVEISDDDGLVLRDVKLGSRTMAKTMSLPYVALELSGTERIRAELRPGGDQAVARSRLVGFTESADASGISIRADYVIDRLPSEDDERAILCVQQTYRFMLHDPFNDCNSLDANCSRFYPLVEYAFISDEESDLELLRLQAAQRFEFEADQPLNNCGFTRDEPALVIGAEVTDTFVSTITFEPDDQNPARHEHRMQAVAPGGTQGEIDNIHQTREPFISTPLPSPIRIEGLFHGGCPECVHIHWRWSFLTKAVDLWDVFFNDAREFDANAGSPNIPNGSGQSVDVGHCRFHEGEDDPDDWRDLIAEPEPYVPETGQRLVFWYEGSSHALGDAFFIHGGFFVGADILAMEESLLAPEVAQAALGDPVDPAALSPILRMAPPTLLPLDSSWSIRLGGDTQQVSGSGSFTFNVPVRLAFERLRARVFQERLRSNADSDILESRELVRIVGFSAANGVMRYVTSPFVSAVARRRIRSPSLDITPIPPRSPQALRLNVEGGLILGRGERRQVQVVGRFADGFDGDLTPRSLGTVYASSNTLIAVVDDNGLVTAVGPGRAFIAAANEGALATADVVVSGGPVTRISGLVLRGDGSPGAGARVSLILASGAVLQTIADAAGQFAFENIPVELAPFAIFATFPDGEQVLEARAVDIAAAGDDTDAGTVTLRPAGSGSSQRVLATSWFGARAGKSDGRLLTWGENRFGEFGNGSDEDSAVPVPSAPGLWSIVAAGASHSLGVTREGTLWSWGSNGTGQLGDGTQEDGLFPMQVGGQRWSAVSAGDGHSIAVSQDGSLWGWGQNFGGQVGNGTFTNTTLPGRIGAENDWVSVGGGAYHSLAIDEAGELWGWGRNNRGQLGDGTFMNRSTPVRVAADILFRSVGSSPAAFDMSAGVGLDGSLWTWGRGVLGDGLPLRTSATRVEIGTDKSWRAAAAGEKHALAIADDGSVWGWGENVPDEAGGVLTRAPKLVPSRIPVTGNVTAIAATVDECSLAIADGTLWSWCESDGAVLGDPTRTRRSMPALVGEGATWTDVAVSASHSAAIDAEGGLWLWGAEVPGDAAPARRSLPTQVPTPGLTWRTLAAGEAHFVAIATDGSLWTWGRNSSAELGDGTIVDRPLPGRILEDRTWSEVAAGSQHSMAVATDGTLWTWGSNASGQLGAGINGVPRMIAPERSWLHVAAGASHSLAIAMDGTLWAWGNNGLGQLGDGTFMNRPAPFELGAGTTWTAVAGGSLHTLALASDGTIWATGANNEGQLGDGTTDFRLELRPLITGQSWTAIAAGHEHSMALAADGSLWTWGGNRSGQLGDGTDLEERLRPHRVGARSGMAETELEWNAVSTGPRSSHVLAISRDGDLWSWGENGSGELGDGRAPFVPLPVNGEMDWGAALP